MTTQYVAIAVGVFTHLSYFRFGEHHRNGIKYLQAAVIAYGLLAAAHRIVTSASWPSCLGASLFIMAHFLVGLYGGLLVYRMLFHPLNHFPGPIGARLGDLWLSMRLSHRDLHEQTLRLYQRYGPFVRVGSSTLMVAHAFGVAAIHGPESKCRKGSMYDFEQPNRGIATRQSGLHAARRRVWSRGFGEKALREYESRIALYISLLLAHLSSAAAAGQSVDVARLMEFFAFDVMGDLGLDQDFGMLRDGRQHVAIEQLAQGMTIMGYRLPAWLMRLIVDVAQTLVSTEATTGFLGFCYTHLDKMLANEKRFERPSLMAPLLAHYESLGPLDRDMSVIRNDCRFIIVAGSDTVAATLGFLFFYLARHPEHVGRLRAELLPLRSSGRKFLHQNIVNAEHLNAVINETLRLHPPASTTMRITPPEGITVANTFIPGDMTVFSSQYVIGRSEAVYERAAEFVPERWYAKSEMIKERAGYAPFSIGHHSCLGRPLALVEMRLLIAECVSRFDVSFASGFDDAAFLESIQDCMSWHMDKLDLCFTNINLESLQVGQPGSR